MKSCCRILFQMVDFRFSQLFIILMSHEDHLCNLMQMNIKAASCQVQTLSLLLIESSVKLLHSQTLISVRTFSHQAIHPLRSNTDDLSQTQITTFVLTEISRL